MLPLILQQLQQNQPQQQQQPQRNPLQLSANTKKLVSLLKGINNPQAFLQEAIKEKNPMIGEVMQQIQNNNGDAQAAFYNLASDLGVDPNEILNLLQ